MRGATLRPAVVPQAHLISIHAPHAGSDALPRMSASVLPDFNPRSPCGERPMSMTALEPTVAFQSTLPMRGATQDAHLPHGSG